MYTYMCVHTHSRDRTSTCDKTLKLLTYKEGTRYSLFKFYNISINFFKIKS